MCIRDRYPHGPVGGLVATLGLAAISLALALPCGVLLALGRISPYRALRWPASAMVYLCLLYTSRCV